MSAGSHPTTAATGGAANAGRLKIALALTGAYLVAEVVGGLLTGSLALISDAAHMLTDVMAMAISLVAITIGQRAADRRRTFGYYRFEILGAALNAAVLFAVAFYILYEAVQRFREPPPAVQTLPMMIVAAIGLGVNLVSMRLLRGGSGESLNMKSAYLEVWSDMLGSIGVIAAALIIRFTGWWQVDPILAVLIGLWVLPRTWTLLSESVNVLLEGVPKGFPMQKLRDALAALPGVKEVHDLHVWSVTSGRDSMTVHLTVEGTDPLATVRAAQGVAHDLGIEHVSVQVEDPDTARSEKGSHPAALGSSPAGGDPA